MSNEIFLSPRLTGARFEGHAIPLEFLKDLAVLEEMLIEIAKSQYRKDHSDRQRTPRGFTEGIELQLIGIEQGSTIPLIGLAVVASGMLFPPIVPYIEKARESFMDAIDAAAHNRPAASHLSESALSYFDRFGRSLREGEAIEFSSPGRQSPVRLTKETRRKLVLASSRVKELTEETSLRGTIPEADQEKMTFAIRLFEGRRISAPLDAQHLDTILEATVGYQSGKRVQVQGIGKFDRNERLLGLESVQHISILDSLDIAARLDEFRLLADGWLEGYGKAPQKSGLDWLSKAFDDNYPDDLPLPYLYPTEDGGVQAEWSLERCELICEFNLESKQGYWHMVNLASGQDEEKDLKLDSKEDWVWLADRIRQLNGGDA